MTGSLVPPSALIAGRYTVERELGHGATATVYLARDQVHGRPVALKVLHPDLTASVGAERFLREIRLTAQLHHPHIVPVLDSGGHDGLLFCVLPYMDGGTLRDRLDREKQLPIEDAVAIARTMGEALAYAHERGLIHRDVKPENILFSVGQPCLADFGIAKALEHVPGDSTSTGIVRGTPAYMSPEQASGDRDYDGRSDVYSLACVLYEMIAGMPAFVGPTTQSLLAQRMIAAPREMSVYRQRVSTELEAVVEKALRPAPADRYGTAREFVEALAGAPLESDARVPTRQLRVSGMWRAQRRWRALAIGAAALLLIALATITWWRLSPSLSPATALSGDTTRVVLLPFERAPGVALNGPEDALLAEAFMGWTPTKPIETFRVSEALKKMPDALSSDDAARRLASSLGAGRYVRGRLIPIGDSLHATLALYDINAPSALYDTVAAFRRDDHGADSIFLDLAKLLLLRGRDDGSGGRPSSRSLPAIGAYVAGTEALNEWDLERADSLFQTAVTYDPEYARAYLELAQTRAWNRRPAGGWRSLAERLRNMPGDLSSRDRQNASALSALARGDFAAACRGYDAMRHSNEGDFVAWYGLGQCRDLDTVVVRDGAGWRYRSSYQQAVRAYARAFEILPSAHGSVQHDAFQSLQKLLFTSASQLRGAVLALPDTQRFWGRPDWRGDTLLMVPIPLTRMQSFDPRSVPAGLAAAIAHEREVFHAIAAGWSAALPRNSGAKEAVAVSLEMIGDPSAVDTIRLARRLADGSRERVRLAAEEAIDAFKFGVPGRAAELRHARELADSLLSGAASPDRVDAAILAPLAAMTGRCVLGAALAAKGSRADPLLAQVTRDVVADAASYESLAALGCSTLGTPSPRDIGSRLPVGPQQDLMRFALFIRVARLTLDSALVGAVERVAHDYIIDASRAVTRGRAADARGRLFSFADIRGRTGGFDAVSPDALLEEARLWISLADTAAAVGWIDKYLPRVRYLTPGMLHDQVSLASLMRLMVLRADLAHAKGDATTARQWASCVRALWSGADPELQTVVRRLASYDR